MKICGIICEFNPFHNGHEYLIKRIKEHSDCDYIVCIMSGSFTQRGEFCILDKFTRAKHAVLSGADCVIELPAAFSVAPAEIFASGAVKILSSIPNFDTLAFGCENCSKEEFFSTAKLLNNENTEFKEILSKNLANGESYIKSYSSAFKCVGGNAELLKKPNNVLGVEYVKAVLKLNPKINILPIKRIGADFNDGNMRDNFSSASAIRSDPLSPLVKNNVPEHVFEDLNEFSSQKEKYEDYLRLVLSRTPTEELKTVYGCGEGLENALKTLQNLPFNEIIEKATSKRYSSSRIMRILCENFLKIRQSDVENYLKNNLYLFPLAISKEKIDGILSALAQSPFPLITSGSDLQKLNNTALNCKKCDDFAFLQWQIIAGTTISNKFLTV